MRIRSSTYRTVCLATTLAGLLTVLPAAANSAGTSSSGLMNESVLDRFKSYSGPRSKEALSGLFTLPASASPVRQQPSIAISDGKTAVMIAVKVPSADGTAPNFSIEGAKMLSLERKQRDEWLIKALPQQGVLRVSLLMINGSQAQAFPLTVAPPLPQQVKPGSQEFATFLDTPAVTGSLHDLNGDGSYDYVDDYIYMSNVLTIERENGRSLKARRERALKRTLSQPSVPARPDN